MALLEWNSSLEVGIKVIDEQHKKLVKMVNDLHDAMRAGKGRELLGKLFSELVGYTDSHFRTEEDLFKKHAYPAAGVHHLEHQKLREQALSLKKQHEDGAAVLTIAVLDFLKKWLSEHISQSDKKLGAFLKTKGEP